MRIFILVFIFAFSRLAIAEDDHAHEPGQEHSETAEPESQHGEHGEDEEHGGHDESEEANPQVGPTKGILEASKDNGIKLSPEAEKNFEITKLGVLGNGNFQIPKSAIVTAATEVNLFRFRNGFYKRIDFILVSKTSDKATVNSKDLKPGDEVVITGLGFLRIAEIAAFGGAPEGHSH